LRKLEEEGLLQFNESYYSPSVLHIYMDKSALYAFQVANASFDVLIKMMLRLFGGELYSGFVKISEAYLAKAMKVSKKEIIDQLSQLHNLKVILYQPAKDKPQVTFLLPRQDVDNLPVDKRRLEDRKKLLLDKMSAMVEYVSNVHRCRMQVIQDYFSEETYQSCGVCDVCIEKRKRDNAAAFEEIRNEVLSIIGKQSLTIEQLEEKIAPNDRELFVDTVRELVDNWEIEYDKFWKLKKTKTK